ncbi:MAG TPA: (Fe-S)-binding protein [Nitrospirae bacterium]|nr:(Fe-S)-binding protein [Nitrospirota bacterium]
MLTRLKEHMERCVRCGSCKADCPTYGQEATEASSARGRVMLVRALIHGELERSELLARRLFSCLLCGLCEPLCPVGVDVTGIVYLGLSELGGLDPRGKVLRKLAREGFLHPQRAFRAGRALAPLLGPVAKKMGLVPFDIKIAKKPLRKEKMGLAPPEGKPVGRVAIFLGCATNFIYPHQGQALIDILLKLGYEVVIPEGEVCCGAPLRSMGMEEDAVELARANIEAFNSIAADAVLSPCPTCTLAIKKQYPALIGEAIENAMDPAEFLLGRADHLQYKGDPLGGVMYHEPCHLAAGLGAGGFMRELLIALGIEFTEPANPTCCGFSQAGVYPEVSDSQLEGLFKEYKAASTLITSCPGCIAQLERRHKNVKHVLELISLLP